MIYICLFMTLGGMVLFVADRLGWGREPGKGISGAVAEGLRSWTLLRCCD